MHRSTILGAIGVTIIASLCVAAVAQANPNNALTPSNVYFGKVVSGQHPTKLVTVRNPTGEQVFIKKFLIAGAGGQKFTLVGTDSKGHRSTCHVGNTIPAGGSCTIIERVKTTKPEYWQAVVSVWYSADSGSGQFNGAVYADVVAAS